MKKLITLCLGSFLLFSCQRNRNPSLSLINKEMLSKNGQNMLVGRTTFSALTPAPYSYWYLENLKTYEPDSILTNQIKEHQDFKVIIYGATWCGDTRRDLPKFSKIMSMAGIRANRYEMYMVDNTGKNYKQSPDKTAYAESIFRVPTFIIERNGKEIGRIIEEPVESLEMDLLKILNGRSYSPAYYLVNRVQEYVLSDRPERLKESSVIEALHMIKENSRGLNSLGYMLIGQEKFKKAIAVFELNTKLFPEDANTFDSLGEAYFLSGKEKLAKKYYQRALELNPKSESAQEMLLKIG
ncbi:MAG: tetratricopeptide (TPR) repeat protein [Arcticibacterium sp.]|jgi:tetratricopeptide (TPR) repeat protein